MCRRWFGTSWPFLFSYQYLGVLLGTNIMLRGHVARDQPSLNKIAYCLSCIDAQRKTALMK